MAARVAAEEPITEETAAVLGLRPARGHCPLENPAVDPIPDDPLREPHPGEPGVGEGGEAAPLENPG
jgi:hypothetical protein